jgi:hypothetical protein
LRLWLQRGLPEALKMAWLPCPLLLLLAGPVQVVL